MSAAAGSPASGNGSARILAVEHDRFGLCQLDLDIVWKARRRLVHQPAGFLQTPGLAVGEGLLIEPGQEQVAHVFRIPAARPNATGVAIDDFAAVLPGLVQRKQSDDTDHGRRDQRVSHHRRLPQGNRDQFDEEHREEDVPRPLAPLLVVGDDRAKPRHRLDRAVGRVAGHRGQDRGDGPA